jgi:hypothetical protein
MVKAARQPQTSRPVTNGWIADQLDQAADYLGRVGANEFRVRAYRRGAETLRAMAPSVTQVLADHGSPGLMRMPGIGKSLARSIEQIVATGRLPLLDRLRTDAAPARVFTTVADVGPKLAERIHRELGIETLADLEAASWDGRLARVPGMGQKRIRAVRESLGGRLRLSGRAPLSDRPQASQVDQPSVRELLEIDEEYRRLAERDRLLRVAPRRFNPSGQAWLPILHAERDGRRYTAMYSNTARAHELEATHDWVVIYRDDKRHAGQWTVITARMGRLKGRRVVRGREDECSQWYAEH